MISRLKGTLLTRDVDRIEVETASGVVYELEVPLTVQQRLPPVGSEIEIRTFQVVREDSLTLYGFLEADERELFGRLLGASGVGAKLAAAMLSTYTAARLARALAEEDVTALKQVSGVGKKTAERIILELSDKVQDLATRAGGPEGVAGAGAQEAVSALVALGYSFTEADRAVRAVLEGDGDGDGEDADAQQLIRRALQRAGS